MLDDSIIDIDGSVLEGVNEFIRSLQFFLNIFFQGGQILRIAISLSALKRIPIRITNIRAGRSKPGLREQHLKGFHSVLKRFLILISHSSSGLELVQNICQANARGLQIGSTEIEFHPREITGGTYVAKVNTAGSVSLLLQVALPCCLFATTKTELYLHGGTNAEMAPQIDYTTEVFRPNLEKFGATFHFDLKRRGYFPKGGGEVHVEVHPVGELQPVTITDRGEIANLCGWSFVAGTLPIRLAHQMADSAATVLRSVSPNLNIERYKEERKIAPENCSGIM